MFSRFLALFRISGRTTHIQRLRIEFDSGADYDMSECGPGEIDPHAVASVFKSYLRECEYMSKTVSYE